MKKYVSILFLAIVALVVWIFLGDQAKHATSPIAGNKETNASLTNQGQAGVAMVASANGTNTFPSKLTTPPASISQPQTLNALAATNLEQWNMLVKNLKYSDKFGDTNSGWESWVMEWPERAGGETVMLQSSNKQVFYAVNFIDVDARQKNASIQRIEMQSPIMNINETRELGLQLCGLLGVDSKDFSAWCDKVGNHWLDAPSFNTGNYQCGFGIHMTYDDDKPWYINFVIVNRER